MILLDEIPTFVSNGAKASLKGFPTSIVREYIQYMKSNEIDQFLCSEETSIMSFDPMPMER